MKNFKFTHFLAVALILNIGASLFLLDHFSEKNIQLSNSIGKLNEAYSKNIDHLTIEANNANEVANNLKDYIVSKEAVAEKMTIGVDSKIFRPDGTFCKVHERTVEKDGAKGVEFSAPFDCQKVVLLSVTTNRLLAAK